MIAAVVAQHVDALGLRLGTHPENLAALRLARAGHQFEQQHRVLNFRLDIAWPALRVGLEVDGPHHHRPDVAHRDALRDARIRDQGWTVLRINTGATFEDQLARVSGLVHAMIAGGAS